MQRWGWIRRRLDLPDAAFVYACLGLMRPYKGLEELLPAFRELAGEDLRLVVAGRPPDEAYVARLRTLTSGLRSSFSDGVFQSW